MSNMIKAYSVRYDDDSKKTIDTHLRIDKEIEQKKNTIIRTAAFGQEGFVEGLKAVVVEALPDKDEDAESNRKVIEEAKNEAKNEAKRIIEQAKKEAEQLKNDTLAAAQKKGYEEGIKQVQREALKLKEDYEDKVKKLQSEYETLFTSLEPQMAQIIAALVEKITGILVEDKEDVILYLINKAVKNMDKSDEYTIRVSKDDFDYITMRKNLLQGAIGREVMLNITEDPTLQKNQCLIETETKVLNCSLDIQLNNLITDLKLIGGI